MMIPFAAARSRPRAYAARHSRRAASATSAPTSSAARAMPMFSSWPAAALVDGVNSGSGSGEDSASPAGSAMPCIVPEARYSFHAEPDR